VELVVRAACGSGACPAIFADGDAMVIVQGYAVDPAEVGLNVPDGELLVRVPRELLYSGAMQLKST
jgi:hypothetical protein